MEKPFCSYFVLSPTRTILEPIIIPVVLLAYLPQYVSFRRRGTVGISPGWMLAFYIFSTAQFSCRLMNRNGRFAVHCIQAGELQGVQAFSALIGYFQVGAQWVGAFVLLVYFTVYRIDADETETAPILASQEPAVQCTRQGTISEIHWTERIKMRNLASDHLVFIACTYSLVLIGLSLILLIVPEGRADLATLLFRALLELAFSYISLATASALLLLLVLLPIYNGAAERRSSALGLSTLFLISQMATLLVLGLVQAFRPGYIVFDDGHWEWDWLYWYLKFGHVAVHYLILASGAGVVLGMRFIHLRRIV